MFHLIQRDRTATLAFIFLLSLAAGIAHGQSRSSIHCMAQVSEPVVSRLVTVPAESPEQNSVDLAQDSNATPNPQPDPASSPALSMFPHAEDARFWLSGQANIIFQGRLPFHSAYEGPNSFRNSAEYKTSLVGTAYTAIRRNRSVRYNTDFIFDMESAAGRGLSEALGLAGFTNLDVVRNPNLGPTPYIARYEIHQTFGLTEKTSSQEANFFALAPAVPERRFEFRVGKMTLPDIFDMNSVGSDSHLQFMNWTIDNNGAWDYAADTRGYTVGGMAEYDDRSWTLRYGIFAMPIVANGIDLDWAFSRAHGQNGEFEIRK